MDVIRAIIAYLPYLTVATKLRALSRQANYLIWNLKASQDLVIRYPGKGRASRVPTARTPDLSHILQNFACVKIYLDPKECELEKFTELAERLSAL